MLLSGPAPPPPRLSQAFLGSFLSQAGHIWQDCCRLRILLSFLHGDAAVLIWYLLTHAEEVLASEGFLGLREHLFPFPGIGLHWATESTWTCASYIAGSSMQGNRSGPGDQGWEIGSECAAAANPTPSWPLYMAMDPNDQSLCHVQS